MTDAQSAATPARRPRRSKQAILTWVAVYPSLTLVLAVLNPLMESWPLWLRTLLVTVLLVPVVVWVILPVLTRVVGDWLYR
jgi:antibiotic biosynthesis monooxygenase (ABM) superfamily enzyme